VPRSAWPPAALALFRYVAAHVSDDNDYLQPTARDTGGVLCQRLSASGEFVGDTICVAGYPALDCCQLEGGSDELTAYNRPSDPAFCGHGMLHISSFVTAGREQLRKRGAKRAVYKILMCEHGLSDRWVPPMRGQCRGWLDAASDAALLLRHPWGVSFAAATGSQADGQVLLCCQSAEDDEASPVVQLPSCGCAALASANSGGLTGIFFYHTRGMDCGVAAPLGGVATGIRKANYITHV